MCSIEKPVSPTETSSFQAGWGTCRPALLKALVPHLGVRTRVLDIGCARGGYTRALQAAGYRAVGIDACVPHDAPRSGLLVQAAAEHMPFADGAFDHGIAINVLEHVDDNACLRECHRVVQGRIVGTLPTQESNSAIADFDLTYHTYTDPSHRRHYTLESAERLFRGTGFRILELRHVHPANCWGAALYSVGFPRQMAERLGTAMHRVPLFRKFYTAIFFVVARS